MTAIIPTNHVPSELNAKVQKLINTLHEVLHEVLKDEPSILVKRLALDDYHRWIVKSLNEADNDPRKADEEVRLRAELMQKGLSKEDCDVYFATRVFFNTKTGKFQRLTLEGI